MKTASRTALSARLLVLLLAGGIGSGTARAQSYVWRTFAGSAGTSGSEDSPGTAARFYQPEGIAIDPAGNLFVTDRSNHSIRKVTPDGVVTTFAGSGGLTGTTNGTGTAARFGHPSGIDFDAAGNLYIADSYNNMIRKITPAGVVTTLAGQPTAGAVDATGTAARFSNPIGVAVDGGGNVFVADYYNHTIRKVSPAGVVSTLAGLAGDPGAADGSVTAARFRNPTGIAIDGPGNLYITEYNNHTLRKITPGGLVTTLAGQAGVSGASAGTGNAARFYSPTGVAVAGDGTLFVADYNNNTIRKVTAGGVVTNVAGTAGTEGAQEGTGPAARFNNPYGIAVDPAGNLFVADRDNSMIRKISTGGFVANFAGTPLGTGTADSPGVGARFDGVRGPSLDAAGNLYVADFGNHTIRKINPSGVVTTIAGQADAGGSTDGSGLSARFFLPISTTISADNTLHVVDYLNSTVRKIAPDGTVSTLAGLAGSYGSTDGTGTAARFQLPQGAAINSAGILHVTDGNNHTIRRIDPGGAVTTLAGLAGAPGGNDGNGNTARFNGPYGIALRPDGSLDVADYSSHTIRRVSVAGGVTTIAGLAGSQGSADGAGASARFYSPTGIAVDAAGNTYITDSGNHTIRKIDISGVVTTLGGTPGSQGSDEGIGTVARFNSPVGIAVGADGLYVTDSFNHRVVKGVPAVTPYAAWLAYHYLASGSNGDDDADGLINLLEFASGTHPRQPQAIHAAAAGAVVGSRGTPSLVTGPGGRGIVFVRRVDRAASGMTYAPQFSQNLGDWFTLSSGLTLLASDGEVEIVSVPFPATLPNGQVPRFCRLSVTIP